MTEGRGARIGEAALGGGLLALGAFLVIETSQLAAGPGYAAVGPALFPYLIGGGLLIVGLVLLQETFSRPSASGEHVELYWPGLALVFAGLVAQALLLGPAGWIIAAAVLFVATARAFGSRRIVVDALIGLALAALAYVMFTFGLGLRLPAGLLFDRLA